MYNSDYIPLDQEIIDQAVNDYMKKRQEAKNVLRDAIKNAGGNVDIIVFDATRTDYSNFRRIIRVLEDLGLCWFEINGELYANRHEVYEVVGYRK